MITFTQENFLSLLRSLMFLFLIFYPMWIILARKMITIHRSTVSILFVFSIRAIVIQYVLEYLIADQFNQLPYHQGIWIFFELLGALSGSLAFCYISSSPIIKTLICLNIVDIVTGCLVTIMNGIVNLMTGHEFASRVYPISKYDLLLLVTVYVSLWLFMLIFSPLLEKFRKWEIKHNRLWAGILIFDNGMIIVGILSYGEFFANFVIMLTTISVITAILLYFAIKKEQSEALFDGQRLRMAVFNSESTMYQIEMTMHLQKEIASQLEKVKAASRETGVFAEISGTDHVLPTSCSADMNFSDDHGESSYANMDRTCTEPVIRCIRSFTPSSTVSGAVLHGIKENTSIVESFMEKEGSAPQIADTDVSHVNSTAARSESLDSAHISQRLELYRDSLNQMYAEMKYTVYCRNWHLNALLNYYYFRFKEMGVQTDIHFQKYQVNAPDSNSVSDSRKIESALNYLMNAVLSEWNRSVYVGVEKNMYIQCESAKGLDILTIRCTLNGRNRLSRRTLKSLLGESMYHLKMEEQTDGMEIQLMLQRNEHGDKVES